MHRSHRHAIEKTEANTRGVFGDYLSVYDIQRAIADKATVPICYENFALRYGLFVIGY